MGTCGDVPENDFLRRPTPEKGGNLVEQLRLPHQEPVLRRHLHGVPKCGYPSRNDGNFLHRVRAGQGERHKGMSQLMVSHNFSFFRIDEAVFLFQTRHHPLNSLFKFGHTHLLLVSSNREQGSLIDQIGEICPDHTGGHIGNGFHVQVFFDRDVS